MNKARKVDFMEDAVVLVLVPHVLLCKTGSDIIISDVLVVLSQHVLIRLPDLKLS